MTNLPTNDLPAAALAMLEEMEEALFVHIYGDDDPIPANSGHVATIQRVAAALGLPPRDIPVVPVFSYSATFCDARTGDRQSFETEVCAHTFADAEARGRCDLDTMHGGASKVDARTVLLAGTPQDAK
jgi:hypothetical protein